MNSKNHEVICCHLDGEYTLNCDFCVKTIKLKPKNKHFKSLYHREDDKPIQKNHTIRNPNFFDKDKIYIDYTTDHNKKFEIYYVKLDFKLDFGPTFQALVTSEICLNVELFHSIEFLERRIQGIVLKRYKFSHITELNIKTVPKKKNLNCEYYIKQPKPMVGIKLNQLLARKSCLINALDRGVKHPLIKKYSHIPFNN